jgi:hypothetical protein
VKACDALAVRGWQSVAAVDRKQPKLVEIGAIEGAQNRIAFDRPVLREVTSKSGVPFSSTWDCR